MENPTLTYVSASLLAGDKSLSVIAHEICHSWSGNLVTNNNWEDFWLNEGFTVFLQIKIFGYVFNDLELQKLLSMTFENVDPRIIVRVQSQMEELRRLLQDYIINSFAIKPYYENDVNYSIFLSMFTTIRGVFDEVHKQNVQSSSKK